MAAAQVELIGASCNKFSLYPCMHVASWTWNADVLGEAGFSAEIDRGWKRRLSSSKNCVLWQFRCADRAASDISPCVMHSCYSLTRKCSHNVCVVHTWKKGCCRASSAVGRLAGSHWQHQAIRLSASGEACGTCRHILHSYCISNQSPSSGGGGRMACRPEVQTPPVRVTLATEEMSQLRMICCAP